VKIVGGDEISISEAPYQAALLYAGGFFCGASIISPNYLITAAHCLIEYKDKLSVRIGSNKSISGGEIFNVDKFFQHPLFNTLNLNNDLAILRVEKNITFVPGKIEAIELVDAKDKLQESSEVFVTGYGLTNNVEHPSNRLRGVILPIVSQRTCRKSYPFILTNQMVCAGLSEGGIDSCQVITHFCSLNLLKSNY
jgi:trypsin